MAKKHAGSAVWNDSRHAAVCDDINEYRAAFVEVVRSGATEPIVADRPRDRLGADEVPNSHSTELRPGPNQDCAQGSEEAFGNTDIYGGTYADPTP